MLLNVEVKVNREKKGLTMNIVHIPFSPIRDSKKLFRVREISTTKKKRHNNISQRVKKGLKIN